MKNIQIRQDSSGFTIVELLVVVVVIAILAAVIVVVYNGTQVRAKVSKKLAEVGQIENKLGIYKETYGSGETYGYGWGDYDYGTGTYGEPNMSYFAELGLGSGIAANTLNCVEIEGIEYSSCAHVSNGALVDRADISKDMYIMQVVGDRGYCIWYYDDIVGAWKWRPGGKYMDGWGGSGESLAWMAPW